MLLDILQLNVISCFGAGNRQLTVTSDCSIFFSITWKSLATVNYLVPNIFQNIFFCVPQLKEVNTGLEQLKVE